jgi:SAM-dependent MidA family methyltransferase
VTAPEISPAFGRLLAAQVAQALERTDTREVWEFGAGTGALAEQLLGTLVCHRAHRMDDNPLVDLGLKDITAHVNFTGIAVAAQEAGMDVLGYTTQAHFLINCGLLQQLEQMQQGPRAMAAKLMMEHEMGELFKVIALSRGVEPWPALGFVQGDRTHRL